VVCFIIDFSPEMENIADESALFASRYPIRIRSPTKRLVMAPRPKTRQKPAARRPPSPPPRDEDSETSETQVAATLCGGGGDGDNDGHYSSNA
jgi:hypothetical protein